MSHNWSIAFGLLFALAFLIVLSTPAHGQTTGDWRADLEREATAISERINEVYEHNPNWSWRLHLPAGTIVDPIFEGPDSEYIKGYRRAGDSAIWTGHYLAAEAYRYAVLSEAGDHDGAMDAYENAARALAGLEFLVNVTQDDTLARAAFPSDFPFLQVITDEEAHNGVNEVELNGRKYTWIGRPSGDQYTGVFFGLRTAYDLIPDLRDCARDLVIRLLRKLEEESFQPKTLGLRVFIWHRAVQVLSFRQVGKYISPNHFEDSYRSSVRWRCIPFLTFGRNCLGVKVVTDHETGKWFGLLTVAAAEHKSYFKYNLLAVNYYHLIGLEQKPRIRKRYYRSYLKFRKRVAGHGNPHFNMMDKALAEAMNTQRADGCERDEETVELLKEWLLRPRRDFATDNSAYPSRKVLFIKDPIAVSPLPVCDRINSDFLWQRSPFQLKQGGDGEVETPAVDFILPYWMARYYGVI